MGDLDAAAEWFDRMMDAGFIPQDDVYCQIFMASANAASSRAQILAEKFFYTMVSTGIQPQSSTAAWLGRAVGVDKRDSLFRALRVGKDAFAR
mmetsp:Transcript_110513/g.342680  ORF Transcript_110513/g.342680 Transcript_110513/m.342680 type:complete len:93 (+) Transcript_110513:97-375(+)